MNAALATAGATRRSDAATARRRLPLSAKLAIALVGLVTLVLAINGAANLWLNYDDAKRAAIGVQREKAQAATERVDGFISDVESQIGWTTRAEWRRVTPEQQRYDFIRLLRQAPAVTEVSYIDPAGKEQLKVSRLEPDAIGSGRDFSGDARFKQAVIDKVWFGSVYFRRGSEPYMTMAVAHAGRNPGVTVAEVNLKLVWDVVTSIKVGDQGYAFVVTSTGRLIAHPDLSLVLRDTDLSRIPQVAQALAAGTRDTSELTLDQNGQQVLSAHARIGRLGWLVFVQSPVSEALAPVYRSIIQTVALLGLGILLATIAGTFLARRMVVPIRRLQEGAERFGSGDLSQRIAIRTGDEIETLADRFNLMASRVQDSYETLEGKVQERTRELGQSLQQQIATADVLKVISRSAFDLDTVLTTLVRSAAELCGVERGMIFLRDGEVFQFRASVGLPPEVIRVLTDNPRRPGRQSVVPRVALSGQIEQISDCQADPEFHVPGLPDLESRAFLGVPLLRDGKVEGVFLLSRTAPGEFPLRQIELLVTFADQAVIAIENARLFEEVKARTAELTASLEQQTATSEVLEVISSSPGELRPVFESMLNNATRICEAEFGVLFEHQNGLLQPSASIGVPSRYAEFLRDRGSFRPEDGAPLGRLLATRDLVHTLDDSIATTPGPAARYGGARSLVAVPMLKEGELVGAIVIYRQEVRPFTDKQIGLVTGFARQAVIAIENVRLLNELRSRTAELTLSLDDLRKTQDRLIQSEKLASLGQLTAGIAHEIKNPLNFVNNFSSLSVELIDELREVLEPAPLDAKVRGEVDELTDMLKGNLDKIVQHGKRADSIVKNMLLHSREGTGDHRMVDVNGLVEESLNLAYHGARAEKPGFNVTLTKSLDPAAGGADLYPQEITRVLLNLISNGFYAAAKRKAEAGDRFEPTLTTGTRDLGDKVEIRIRDNGTGIPDDVREKIFNPFFTTKPAGEGTGLGLSLSHDIVVKQHGGTMDVATEPGAFTEFTIVLPRAGIHSSAAKSGS